jgi:hypothetical protein
MRVELFAVGVGVVVAFTLLGWGSSPAFAATTVTVSSTADALGTAGAGQCTLRDALVVADVSSNSALGTNAEPGGSGAAGDCSGEVSGSGSPYTVVLASGTMYTLGAVDNYWFGPDGLPPISATVTIEGNGATIVRSSAAGAPAFRFFYVSGGLSGPPAGNLTLEDVALSNGPAQGGNSSDESSPMNGTGGGTTAGRLRR